jgi:uncharacterized protein YciI
MSTEPTFQWTIHTRPRVPWAEIAPRIGEHASYQSSLLARDQLIASGPFVDETGSPTGEGFAVIRAPDRASAEAIASQDPLVLAGLRRATVHRWRINQHSGDLGTAL